MLEKLVIKKGYFCLRTALFFRPVLSLEIGASLDPGGKDMLLPEHFDALRDLVIDKIPPESDKAFHIVNAISSGSPNLLSLSINLQGIQPKRTLDTLFAAKPNLR